MSAGLTFIRSCIDNGARTLFMQTPVTMFVEEELRHHGFVMNFLSEYGGMPPMPVMVENQLALPIANGPTEYFVERLRDRVVYKAYADRQPQINQAFTTNDHARARALIAEIYLEITAATQAGGTVDISDALQQSWDDYMEARDNPNAMIGITYGNDLLDEITGGLRNGDVGTIVARPGIGKTFKVVLAAVRAWQAGASINFVSNEMMAPEIARRIIGMETGINHDMMQRGRMSTWAEEGVQSYLAEVDGRAPFRLLIGDLSKSIADVDATIQEHSPDFVCVDASYLLQPVPNGQFRGKRYEAMAEVAEGIKSLALRRNKPILQTVQFNRSGTQEDEMDLSQIGGTDTVGQVSALVLGMRRGPAPFERSRRKCVVLKNRHGIDHTEYLTRFEFSPFNMDVVEDEPTGEDENGEWDGTVGDAPPNQDWGGA